MMLTEKGNGIYLTLDEDRKLVEIAERTGCSIGEVVAWAIVETKLAEAAEAERERQARVPVFDENALYLDLETDRKLVAIAEKTGRSVREVVSELLAEKREADARAARGF